MDDGFGDTFGQRWSVGAVELLRVPYFDIGVPAAAIGFAGDELVGHPLAAPEWIDGEGLPTVGQAFWVIRSAGATIVVDPCGASDQFLRTGPEAVGHQDAALDRLRAAGVDPDEVSILALTHLDGIGMAALVTDDGWAPAFPNARIVVTERERSDIAERAEEISGSEAFEALAQQGVVDPVDAPHRLADGVTLEPTGGHSPGHAVVVIRSEGVEAVLLGHLAISPLHLVGSGAGLHHDAEQARATIRRWVARSRDDGTILTGSLWPAPGAVRVTGTDPLCLATDHGRPEATVAR